MQSIISNYNFLPPFPPVLACFFAASRRYAICQPSDEFLRPWRSSSFFPHEDHCWMDMLLSATSHPPTTHPPHHHRPSPRRGWNKRCCYCCCAYSDCTNERTNERANVVGGKRGKQSFLAKEMRKSLIESDKKQKMLTLVLFHDFTP